MSSAESMVDALGAAFGDTQSPPKPAAAPAPAPEPQEAAEAPPEEEPGEPALVDEAQGEVEAAQQEPVAEPEFLIEVNGQQQTVRGQDQIKELLQKGMDYAQKSEYNARTRDSLAASQRQMALASQFHSQILADMTNLQAIDQRLSQFQQVDMAAEFEKDPFGAMKIKEQRDQLREARNALAQQIQAKEGQFRHGQAEATKAMLVAEEGALLAKLPEWRNSDTKSREQAEIVTMLKSFGFNDSELANLNDHRYVLVVRELMDLKRSRAAAATKQTKAAPPVVKPGAVSQQSNKQATFRKATTAIKTYGRQGDHRAQEALVTKMLERTFK